MTISPDKEFLPTKDVVLVMIDDIKIETADEYEAEPEIVEGEKVELIVHGGLVAADEAPTIIKGYNLKFKDNAIRPKLMNKLQGGNHQSGNSSDTGQKYTGPNVGALKPVKISTVDVYTKIYAANGFTGEYIKTSFTDCVGDLVNFAFKANEFFASEFTIKSRPNAESPVYTMQVVDKLPEERRGDS